MNPSWKPSYDLPESTTLSLPGRGTTVLWDSGPPPPTDPSDPVDPPVLLIHGWNIDAPTNYGYIFPHIQSTQRVVMFDQHGHGNGPRRSDPYTLDDAAADAVAVLDALNIRDAIIVGYSLGGAVAQTLAHRHPHRCAGIVLAATAGRFSETRGEAAQFAALSAGAAALRRIPAKAQKRTFEKILAITTRKYPDWIADIVSNSDPINLLEAGASLGTFDSSDWADLATIPSSFVITATDTIVAKKRQVELATRLDVGSLHTIAAGHEVPILNDDMFCAALGQAIREVTLHARVAP